MEKSIESSINDCSELGSLLAQEMIENGAMDILRKAENLAFKEEMPQRL
jgi:hydroxymethylbilane synthase